MPVITVTMRNTTQEKKNQLVKQLTATAISVTGISADHFVVLITELNDDNIGLGGRTVEELHQTT